MRDLVRSQKKDWDVTYAPGDESPINGKMDAMNDFAAFRLQFFGGVVDVIARDYQVEAGDKG